MRILTVATAFPYPPIAGTKIVCYERIRQLARRHDVTLLCVTSETIGADAICEMERYCRCVLIQAPQFRPAGSAIAKAWQLLRSFWLREPYFIRDRVRPEAIDWIQRNAGHGEFDVVEADSDACIYLRAKVDAVKVAVIHSVLEAAAERELAVTSSLREKARIFLYVKLMHWVEARLVQWVDLCAMVTPENTREFQRLHPNAHVSQCLSIGIDLEYFSFEPPDDRCDGVCFVGKMDYGPNIDAALWFYQHVFPIVRLALPDFRFSVVGNDPVEAIRALANDPAVEVTGFVDDVRPYVRRAGMMILPMRMGSGILNKILQSLALGVPVVATMRALEGLTVVPERDLLVAGTPAELAAAIVRLATDGRLRSRLAHSGRAYVEQNHQWSETVGRYESEIQTLLRWRESRRDHGSQTPATATK